MHSTTSTTMKRSRQPSLSHEPVAKVPSLSPAPVEAAGLVQCQLPPHGAMTFATAAEYEHHYARDHVNRCLECLKNFPSAHYLNLHIAEHHDPITAIKRDRGDKTFACLVQGCDKLCSSRVSRRMHLVVKHDFPRDYDIYVISDGLANKQSLLRSEQHHKEVLPFDKHSLLGARPDQKPRSVPSPVPHSAASTPCQPMDDAVEQLSTGLSALQFVPRSVKQSARSSKGRATIHESV